MHIVEANDWKDAAITLLEPRSPYRPWRTGPEPLRAEERVLAVLRTDPVSVLTVIGYADANGNATFGRYTSLDLLDATTLALIAEIPRTKDPRLNWTLDDSTGEDIELALEELWFRETRSCGSDTPRSSRPESCCSHVASAPVAKRTSAFAGSLPATASTFTPLTRHRAAASPPTGRPLSARGVATRWATTSSTSGSRAIRSARSATPVAR